MAPNDQEDKAKAEIEAATAVAPSKLNLPEFYRKDPSAWLTQVEMFYHLHRITSDRQKYYNTACALPTDVFSTVMEVIQNPPEHNRYDMLKKAIIDQYSLSQTKRLEALVDKSDFGDAKPSEIYRQLSRLAGDDYSNNTIRRFWKRRLPKIIQVALTGTDEQPIQELLVKADELFDVSDSSSISRVDSAPSTSRQSSIEQRMDVLTQHIAQLQETFTRSASFRSNSPRRSRSPKFRPRSRSRTPSKRNLCWYHFRFGANANRCISPCGYHGPKKESTNQPKPKND